MNGWYIFFALLGAFVLIKFLASLATSQDDPVYREEKRKAPEKNPENKRVIWRGEHSYFTPKTDDEIAKWIISLEVSRIGTTFSISQMEVWKKEEVNDDSTKKWATRTLVLGISCSYEIRSKEIPTLDRQKNVTAVYEVCVIRGRNTVVFEHARATIQDYQAISWGHGKKRWNDPGGPLTEHPFNDFEIKDGAVEIKFGTHLRRNYLDYSSEHKDTRYVINAKYPLGTLAKDGSALM